MKYRFGSFEVDSASKELRKDGVPLKLGEQPFHVLAALLERAGQEVSRDEIERRIWSDGTHVDFDKGLNSAVNKLRDALSDSSDRPRYIETVPRRGYRFIARLEIDAEPAPVSGSRIEAAAVTRAGPRNWRAIGITSVIVLALIAAAAGVLARRDPAPVAIRSLLILPFQSMNSGDGDYLGQGISEQVTARLMALPHLRLISPAAAERIGPMGLGAQEAGRRFNAEAILFGSVRRVDAKIRVNAQLIRSADRQVLWAAGGLDVEGRDLLEAERLLAIAIATRVSHSINSSTRTAIVRRSTSSAEGL